MGSGWSVGPAPSLEKHHGTRKSHGILEQGIQQGLGQGQQAALLQVCEAKGFALDPDQIRRIEECTDLEQLKMWLTEAVQADSVDDLFD